MTTKKYLGIDYGLHHLGLALNYESYTEPYAQIRYNEEIEVFKQLKTICEREKVEAIVLGLSENVMADKTRAFGNTLLKELGLPIYYQDETLTSQEARQTLMRNKKRGLKVKQSEHQVAAAFILASFLENQGQ